MQEDLDGAKQHKAVLMSCINYRNLNLGMFTVLYSL
jgi:hypothetical protein